ncbi:MAG: homoserine dehydrogenase [Flavobacteriales bacterium]|nr:homoserine dehydrogenase [Flavobacteriales bacterium]
MKKIKAGLFGFGVVGEGIWQVIGARPALGVEIVRVVIRQAAKPRHAPASLFTTDAQQVLGDPEISLVIELIDDADAALKIALSAMEAGKSVISANKKMIAENHSLLIGTARKYNVSFLYEAAVCGSVPVIRNLEEYFDNDLITDVCGIVNGSTNYILTRMMKTGCGYEAALKEAQSLGFAESNPALDVEGIDARNKLKIIALHAFGVLVPDEQIAVRGIDAISPFDLQYAKEKDLVIKLLATCRRNEAGELEEVSVLPTFLPRYHPLRLTDNEFNGVLIGGELTSRQFMYGKGAGRYPTSSAVLSDVSAFRYNYRYAYKKGVAPGKYSHEVQRKVYVSFPPGYEPDLGGAGKVEISHQTEQRNYVVLTGGLKGLQSLVKDPKVSVICYN